MEMSIVWVDGTASVQLLLCGKYRAINHLGKPSIFDDIKLAVAYADVKVPIVKGV